MVLPRSVIFIMILSIIGLIRRSIEKPVYKEKLRIRGYGDINPDSPVFVELKKKYKKVVYKRRLILPSLNKGFSSMLEGLFKGLFDTNLTMVISVSDFLLCLFR